MSAVRRGPSPSPSASPADAFYRACPLCAAAASLPVVAFAQLAFVQCRCCGLIYKSRQAPGLGGYDAAYFQAGPAQYLRRRRHRVAKCRRQLLDLLALCPGARTVVDVGCAGGQVMEAAAAVGLEGCGVDCSPFAVDACRRLGLVAKLGQMQRLPLADASACLVTAKHTLEHVDDPRAALAEVRRVLRPGGLCLLVVPDAAYWKRRLMPRRGSMFRPDRAGWQHHVYYGQRQLGAMAKAAGLTPVWVGKAVPWPLAGWAGLRHRLGRWARRLGHALAAALHLRREIQLIVRREGGLPS